MRSFATVVLGLAVTISAGIASAATNNQCLEKLPSSDVLSDVEYKCIANFLQSANSSVYGDIYMERKSLIDQLLYTDFVDGRNCAVRATREFCRSQEAQDQYGHF
jgi:hypothetical protein